MFIAFGPLFIGSEPFGDSASPLGLSLPVLLADKGEALRCGITQREKVGRAFDPVVRGMESWVVAGVFNGGQLPFRGEGACSIPSTSSPAPAAVPPIGRHSYGLPRVLDVELKLQCMPLVLCDLGMCPPPLATQNQNGNRADWVG